MADVKISQLPVATTPVDGTEVLPIVQSATTKQVSIANLTAGRAMSASSLTLTTPLAVTSGGTGIATAAQGSLLSATGADTFSATRTPTLGLAGTAAGTLGLSGSTSGVVTLATAATAGTWTFTLPTSGGTNGFILTTNGSGVTSWTNPTALGVDLDVGTTAITGGTTGRVLYNNAGVLGEYSVTGTGSVVLGTTPTFTTSALFPAGTVSAPGISVSGDTNTGIYFPAADTIGFVEGGVESMRLDSSGRLTVGATTYSGADVGQLAQFNAANIAQTSGGGIVSIGSTSTAAANLGGTLAFTANTGQAVAHYTVARLAGRLTSTSNYGGYLQFETTDSAGAYQERMRIDASGNLLVGTTTTRNRLTAASGTTVTSPTLGALSGTTFFGGSDMNYGLITGQAGSGDYWAQVQRVDGTATAYDLRLQPAGGAVLITKADKDFTSNTGGGIILYNTQGITITKTAGANLGSCLYMNRGSGQGDGNLVEFAEGATVEGTISVSGTTVSYNGGHLARFSQLPSTQIDSSILKGTVMSNLDEMCVWEKNGVIEPNEQCNKMKVSDVEGDVNVAGVFVNWAADDTYSTQDMNVAMTGDMIIRIADGVVVQKGDLLMSAGDGTAKPQGDDIVRSKTIAKVTSNHVTCTYDDGSYCVPCVLMAC